MTRIEIATKLLAGYFASYSSDESFPSDPDICAEMCDKALDFADILLERTHETAQE